MHVDENPLQYARTVINEIECFTSQLAKEYGVEHLAGPQGFAIMHLRKHEEEKISFKDMEQALKLSKSVTSNLMKRMEKNGFIQIQSSQTDKRVKYVSLTEFGRSRGENLQGFLEYVHQVMLNELSKEDFEVVGRVARQLQENIRRAKKEIE